MIFITGGAGFIGANFVHAHLAAHDEPVVVIDCLSYAGNLDNLAACQSDRRFTFARVDINDRPALDALLRRHQPRALVHFAAESHIDRSIDGPADFVHTNIHGTFNLLEAVREYWRGSASQAASAFRFLQVSTDEVYGSLAADAAPFTETSAYAPNNPYAASKAGADHLVRAYHHTYGLPTLTTHCSNNHGPFQFPEKLIPLVIVNALGEQTLPVYGDGSHVRDWLHVSDHCAALLRVLNAGRVGEVYGIGANAERRNIDVVTAVCALLDELRPRAAGRYAELVRFIADRPGHDRRYAINASKLRSELGWAPRQAFDAGLRDTVQWYLAHPAWIERVRTGEYRRHIAG